MNDDIANTYKDAEAWAREASGGDIPRRTRIDLAVPPETAIRFAIKAVEAYGADIRLTDAVVLLQAARERVADYIDGVEGQRQVPRPPESGPPTRALGTSSTASEVYYLIEALRNIRVYVRDCIETGHDRTMLGNLYSARDEIDAALSKARVR